MMREGAPKTIYRKDYTEPDFLISHVELAFEIADGNTRVTSALRIQRNGSHERPLVLDGEGLGLISVSVDGGTLDEAPSNMSVANSRLMPCPMNLNLVLWLISNQRPIPHSRGSTVPAPCTAPSARQRAIERSLSVLIARTFYQPTPVTLSADKGAVQSF